MPVKKPPKQSVDPWSSVEAMLRWQIDETRKELERISGSTLAFAQTPQVRTRPDGSNIEIPAQRKLAFSTPQHWPWGSRTSQQVRECGERVGIKAATEQLAKADRDLSAGDYVSAIYRLVDARKSIQSIYIGRNGLLGQLLWRSMQASTELRDKTANKERVKRTDEAAKEFADLYKAETTLHRARSDKRLFVDIRRKLKAWRDQDKDKRRVALSDRGMQNVKARAIELGFLNPAETQSRAKLR